MPQSILYDNTKLAVARILGDGRRQRTKAFTELQSHYLFDDRFGRPAKGNDKGKVEGMVGYVRRNFLVPIPSFESFDALNAHLERRCLERMDATLRGHAETIGQRMERDLDSLLPLPSVPYDACDRQAGRVSSLSLVRYRTNDFVITSNRAVDEWLGLFEDPILGNSALDRLANASYQIVIEGNSYRERLSPHRAFISTVGGD